MSLINDALKRAAEAQGQAQAPAQPRARGPKGIEDLPVPMTPVATRERPAWLPAAGIGLLVVILLSASGFFFAKWWKERQSWQPYAETPPDPDPATNAVAKSKPPPDTKQGRIATKAPPVTPLAATNSPVKTNVAVVAVAPQPKPVTPEPPSPRPAPPTVSVAVNPPPKQPDVPAPAPVVKPEPPPVSPPATTPPKVETNPVVVIPPSPPPKRSEPVKVAAVQFPELKLQGIIRGKKKITAIVNGKTLSVGDRIEGASLLKIDLESVTFEKGIERRELFLLR